MKYRNSRTRLSFLENFLQMMVALVVMVLATFQLNAAPVIISTTDNPTLIGTQNQAGAIAFWENAGTIDGVSIDLRATITATDANTVEFYTNNDDPTLTLTPPYPYTADAYVTIKWEIFISGTNQTVAAVGDVTLGITDIDGIGGPNTREAISASLTDLDGYIVDNPTNLQVDVVPSLLRATGTESFKKLKIRIRIRRQENEFYS